MKCLIEGFLEAVIMGTNTTQIIWPRYTMPTAKHIYRAELEEIKAM